VSSSIKSLCFISQSILCIMTYEENKAILKTKISLMKLRNTKNILYFVYCMPADYYDRQTLYFIPNSNPLTYFKFHIQLLRSHCRTEIRYYYGHRYVTKGKSGLMRNARLHMDNLISHRGIWFRTGYKMVRSTV
jgi:hypothetical protein